MPGLANQFYQMENALRLNLNFQSIKIKTPES